jgi:DNA-binding MarR family transcriptional regulator
MSKPASEATHATTLEIRDRCLCLHAQRAARALARRFDRAFRPLELTSGQFSLLNALNRPEPVGIGAVAAVLAMDRTTLTAALKPLERRGLVRSWPGEDRRSRRLALTDAGRALLGAAVPVWRRVHAEVDREVEAAGGLRAALDALSGRQGTSR